MSGDLARDVLFLKPGMGMGGATNSAVEIARYVQEGGGRPSFLTGFLHPNIESRLKNLSIRYRVDERLDRQYPREEREVERILGSLGCPDVIVMSQVFCEREQNVGAMACRIASQFPTSVRIHDCVPLSQSDNLQRLALTTLISPTTELLGEQIQRLNSRLPVDVIPSFVDLKRFDTSLTNEAEIRHVVRRGVGIGEDDVMLFQPTRVSIRKGIDYSTNFRRALEQELGQRVFLVVAGGIDLLEPAPNDAEPLPDATALRSPQIIFLNGRLGWEKRRLSDYIVASDLVVCPSSSECLGLGTAEAALGNRLAVTRKYVDYRGEPVFERVYTGFAALVDDLTAEEPSGEIVEGAASYIRDPLSWAERLEENRALAVDRFTQEHLARRPHKLRRLLHV